jgi:hypothetical protein
VAVVVYRLIPPGGHWEPVAGWRDLTATFGPQPWPVPVVSIIRDRKKLELILHNVFPGKPPKPPPIDFAHRLALLYTLGPRSSTGYHLNVVFLRQKGNNILVDFREQTPTLRVETTPKLTYPYRLLTIPRTTKQISFHVLYR